jgi:hypothetical protein
MQLHLETAELNLLANALLERISAISTQTSSNTDAKSQQAAGQLNDLLDKILVHDLRLDGDELQQAAEVLAAKKRGLKDLVAQEPDAARKAELQRKLSLLERALERIDEACVMF